MKDRLRFAVIGCGFWAKYQIAGWKELEGVELVALYNRTISKAAELATLFNVPAYYDDINLLFEKEKLDFVDIITDVASHAAFTKLSVHHGIAVVCQKPMANTIAEAEEMIRICREAKIPLYINENFRWQAPIREIKKMLNQSLLGNLYKARISYCSAFPVIEKQPFLADLENFILTDIGSHVLDVTRFLLGEVRSLYCRTHRVNQRIKGEDVASVSMLMNSGVFCLTEMSYASILEKDSFPQTLISIEGEKGSIQLLSDYEIRITTRSGTNTVLVRPAFFDWVDPEYEVVQSSIVACNQNILRGLQHLEEAETTGDDNFETVRLVWAAYESARTNQLVHLPDKNIIF